MRIYLKHPIGKVVSIERERQSDVVLGANPMAILVSLQPWPTADAACMAASHQEHQLANAMAITATAVKRTRPEPNANSCGW